METLLTGTDQDGYFSCRGLAGLYLLAVLPCKPPHILDHTLLPSSEPLADETGGVGAEGRTASADALAAVSEAALCSAGDGEFMRAPLLWREGQETLLVRENREKVVQVSMLALARSSSWQDEIENVKSVSAHWQGVETVVPESDVELALLVESVRYRKALEMLQLQQRMQQEQITARVASAREQLARASDQAAAARREMDETQADGAGQVDNLVERVAQMLEQLKSAEAQYAEASEAVDAADIDAAQTQAQLHHLMSVPRDPKVHLSVTRMRALIKGVMQQLPHSFAQMLVPGIAPWGGGEDGGWEALFSAERAAITVYVKAAELEKQRAAAAQEAMATASAATAAALAAASELKEARSMAAGNVAQLSQRHVEKKKLSDEAQEQAAATAKAAEAAKVAAKDAALKAAELEAAVEAGERTRTSRWSSRRVLLPPGGRLGMRLLVCPALEQQQSIVALTWNPAYHAVILRMVVITPWGQRITYLQPQSISSDPFSSNLHGSPTQPNGNFLVTEQPRALMGFDDGTDGGPVLCACWGHASSGNFKIAVSMATKGPTKEQQEAAKACATNSRNSFYKAMQFTNESVERAFSQGAGKSGTQQELNCGKAPTSVQDPRLQIQLRVFSHNGGVQLFCPGPDGFFRSGEWNGCLVSPALQKALPFVDGNEHREKVQRLLNENDVTGAWKQWKTFKRSGTGLDEDVEELRTMVFATQTRLIACAQESLRKISELQKERKIHEARVAWMAAQEHLTNAGVIVDKVQFDNFSNVKGRILPADNDVEEEQEVLFDRSVALKYADSLAETHKGIKNSEVVLRILRRMSMKLLNFCWEHWCDHVAYQQKMRESARKVLKRMKNICLALALETWVHQWSVQKGTRELLQRIMGLCLEDHWLVWMHTVHELLAGRRAERKRLDEAYADAENALLIASGLRESKMLHEKERKCYGFLLSMQWEGDDLVSSVEQRKPGRAILGFDADNVEDVDWEVFTARHAEKHKLHPSVFSRLAKDLKQQAHHFLGHVKPLCDENCVDVPAVLSWIYESRRQQRQAAHSSISDAAIVSLIASRRGHLEEMAGKCRRLAVTAVEVWRRARWLGEKALVSAEEHMLAQRVALALLQVAEAERRLGQANALSKRPAMVSVNVRALAALKLFRAIARRAKSADARGDGATWGELHDPSFQAEITFTRLLDVMKKQVENHLQRALRSLDVEPQLVHMHTRGLTELN